MSIEPPGALMYPPQLVKVAARHAFREHSRTAGRPVSIVFDSNRDEVTRDCAPRLLMFTGDAFDLIVTISTTSQGKALGGAVTSATRIAVGIRRPRRALIAVPVDDAGALAEIVLPPGPACVVVQSASGGTYQSNWLTL